MQTNKTVAQSIVNGLPSNFLENMTTIPGLKLMFLYSRSSLLSKQNIQPSLIVAHILFCLKTDKSLSPSIVYGLASMFLESERVVTSYVFVSPI